MYIWPIKEVCSTLCIFYSFSFTFMRFMMQLLKPSKYTAAQGTESCGHPPISTALHYALWKMSPKKQYSTYTHTHRSNSRGSHALKVQVTKATDWWLALSPTMFFQEWNKWNDFFFFQAEFNYSCRPVVMSNSQGILSFNFSVPGEWCLSDVLIFFFF